jgi:hypothetical protein
MYDFLWMVLSFPLILFWLATGGVGWLFAALIVAVIILRGFVFVQQLANNSPKIVTSTLANSTDGDWFDECDPIGVREVEVPGHESSDGQPIPIHTACFPAVYIFELGTGQWGLARKWGGNEHGFLIVNKDLALRLSDGGNISCLGPTVTYKPVQMTILNLLRQVKPTDKDSRSILPDEWWAKLRAHPRFNVKKSAVHVVIDPAFPIISVSRLGKPILMLPGADAIPGKRGRIFPTTFYLKDLVGGDSPVLDMRPEMKKGRDAQLVATREELGAKIDAQKETIQWLREELAAANAMQTIAIEGDGRWESMKDTMIGKEATGERIQ